MTEYPKIVAASLNETATKFALAEALATEIPERPRGGAQEGRTGLGVNDLLEVARQEIIAAGGEPRSVATMMEYRITGLWVKRTSGNTESFAWVKGQSFTAHGAGRRTGATIEEWAANPTRQDLDHKALQRTNGQELVELKAKHEAELEAITAEVRAEMEAKAAEQRARLQAEAEASKVKALAEQDAAAVAKARHAAEQHARQARAAALRDLAAQGKEAGRSAAEGTITEHHLVTSGCPASVPSAHLVAGYDAEEVGAFSEGFSKGFVEIWNHLAKAHQQAEHKKLVAQRQVEEEKRARVAAEERAKAAEARAAQQRSYEEEQSVRFFEENAATIKPESWARLAAAQLSVLATA